VKYIQLAARLLILALLVLLVGFSLSSKDADAGALTFVIAFVLVAVVELAATVGLKHFVRLYEWLQKRVDKETSGVGCVLIAWLFLSVPPLVVLLGLWFLVPFAVPGATDAFRLVMTAPFVVAIKGVFSVWTGTPFRLIRFVVNPSK
jgi:hypothetical protein